MRPTPTGRLASERGAGPASARCGASLSLLSLLFLLFLLVGGGADNGKRTLLNTFRGKPLRGEA